MTANKRVRLDVASFAGVIVGLGLVLLGQAFEGGSIRFAVAADGRVDRVWRHLRCGAAELLAQRHAAGRASRSGRSSSGMASRCPGRSTRWSATPCGRARTASCRSTRTSNSIEDPFLKKAIQQLVDATTPDVLRDLLETESQGREDYDEIPARVLEAAGGFAPTIGILGAVIGLIQVMEHLSDPSKLGAGHRRRVRGHGLRRRFGQPVLPAGRDQAEDEGPPRGARARTDHRRRAGDPGRHEPQDHPRQAVRLRGAGDAGTRRCHRACPVERRVIRFLRRAGGGGPPAAAGRGAGSRGAARSPRPTTTAGSCRTPTSSRCSSRSSRRCTRCRRWTPASTMPWRRRCSKRSGRPSPGTSATAR